MANLEREGYCYSSAGKVSNYEFSRKIYLTWMRPF